jgi:predicted transcriptional regulator
MDEARAVLGRLERIEQLEREGVAALELLGELRELVREAEAWARVDGDDRAHAAVSACAESLASEMIAM